jgi:hypothetical protein
MRVREVGMEVGTVVGVVVGMGGLGGVGASSASSGGMSRTKKEIVSAVINGKHIIQIERLNNACQSHGLGDDFE